MPGTILKIPTTHSNNGFTGYFAAPENNQKGPGVVIIQEIFGVNSHIKSVVDLYAAAGYAALAPDLFWRAQPNVELAYDESGIKTGASLVEKVGAENMVQDLIATVEALKKQPQCNGKVAAVGYCLGGYLAFRLACSDAVDAASCYYGGRIAENLDKADQLYCPVLMHFGSQDKHIPLSAVETIEKTLTGKGHLEVYVYDADHGFNCDARASYDRKSAMLAYGRTQIMLNKALS